MYSKCIRQLRIDSPMSRSAVISSPQRMTSYHQAATQNAIALPHENGQQHDQEQQGAYYSYFRIVPTLLFTSYLYLHDSDSDQNQAFAAQPSKTEHTKGLKENKIRFFGSPQQIYSYFASAKGEDGEQMTYYDFLRALTPYNYNKPRVNKNYFNNYRHKVDRIMHIADVDKDGLISFSEFFFFVMICQTPSRYVKEDFKKHGGKMNVEQLCKCLGHHKMKTQFTQKHIMKNDQLQDFRNTKRLMCYRIFGTKESITYDEYMAFRNKLNETLWHFEFHQYERNEQEQISTYDLARSLYIYYIPNQKIPEYMKHLDKFEDYKTQCCNVHQYQALQYFLKQKAKIIQVVLDRGKIDFDGLRQLADEFEQENEFCKSKNAHITDEMLEVFLHAMDLEGNGILDVEDIQILTTRKELGSRQMKQRKALN